MFFLFVNYKDNMFFENSLVVGNLVSFKKNGFTYIGIIHNVLRKKILFLSGLLEVYSNGNKMIISTKDIIEIFKNKTPIFKD